MARTLGVDLGSRRIGIAISDDKGAIATPYAVIERTSDENDARSIAEIARLENAKTVVLGYPLMLDGSAGHAAMVTEGFAEKLKQAGMRVKLFDERLTTAEADKKLKGRGMKGRARRAVVDKVAAAVLLQSFLDTKARK
ncbi:MAG TPA: Holliday junction resolvase RuvX [Actinomycetota bacterium]|nr:Holliday junction resolvase RuvX [Actinomycetota bacterium]